VNQYRNHSNISTKSSGYLTTHVVVSEIQPPLVRDAVFKCDPLSTYYGNQDVAGSYRVLNHSRKIRAGPDTGNVHEDATGEPILDSIKESPGVTFRIVATVTDEYVLR
jgi:hypothetical protein